MRQGSLVKYIKDCDYSRMGSFSFIKWLPVLNQDYVIREIAYSVSNKTLLVVTLEEGCVGRHPRTNDEFGIPASCFVELQPPMSILFLLEEESFA